MDEIDHRKARNGAILLAARKKTGLNQEQVAKLLGWPQGHVSRRENGKLDIPRERLADIARVYGKATALEIIAEDDDSNKKETLERAEKTSDVLADYIANHPAYDGDIKYALYIAKRATEEACQSRHDGHVVTDDTIKIIVDRLFSNKLS